MPDHRGEGPPRLSASPLLAPALDGAEGAGFVFQTWIISSSKNNKPAFPLNVQREKTLTKERAKRDKLEREKMGGGGKTH